MSSGEMMMVVRRGSLGGIPPEEETKTMWFDAINISGASTKFPIVALFGHQVCVQGS